MGKRTRANSGRRVGLDSHGLEFTHGPRAISEYPGRRLALTRLSPHVLSIPGERARYSRRWRGDGRYRCRASGWLRSTFPQSYVHAWRGQVWHYEVDKPG